METKKSLKKALVALALTLGLSMLSQNLKPSTNSFDYKTAIGVRAGETSGLTVKQKFNTSNAFEGIISVWPYTIGLTGLYEKHFSLNPSGLNWYAGLGGHINLGGARYRSYYVYRRDYVYVRRSSDIALGIDGILGLEYKFKPIPMAISTDVKPFVETSTHGYTYFTLDPSIGIKITF